MSTLQPSNVIASASGPGSIPLAASAHEDGPFPQAPFNHLIFPRILESVLQFPESWLPVRPTNSALKNKVDALLYGHIVIKAAKREHWNAAPIPDNFLKAFAYMYDFAESGLCNDDLLPGAMEWNGGVGDCGHPLVTVLGRRKFLPRFPPRRYHGMYCTREYLEQRRNWARLLQRHTKIVDFYTECCRIDDLDDALAPVQVDVLRIFVTSNVQCFFAHKHAPVTSFKKLVLVPKMPLSKGFDCPSLEYLEDMDVRKVVINVDWSPKLGPIYPRLHNWSWVPGLHHVPFEAVNIVYIFRRLSDAEEQVALEAGMASFDMKQEDPREGHEHGYHSADQYRWRQLFEEVFGRMRMDQVMLPVVTLVGCPDWKNDHIGPDSAGHGFDDTSSPYSAQSALMSLLRWHQQAHKLSDDTCKVYLDNLKMVTRDEYAATLSSHDFGLEIGCPLEHYT